MNLPLYRRLLGADFERLPPQVRTLHDITSPAVWSGRADVERGASLICRLIAAIARLPPSGRDQPLTVTFTPEHGGEIWHRAFGTRVFPSRQSPGPALAASEGAGHAIHEQVGPARLTLTATVSSDGLTLRLARLHVLGIPVPRALTPEVATREHDVAGRYQFEVDVHVPLLGRLVRYAGWLEPTSTTGPLARVIEGR